MRFGSVCSGIEAASVAFAPLGWKAAWLAEIEKFPAAVLAHHYPDVPNLGDMTTIAARIDAGEVEAPDGLWGGTPCQAFSVAGLRRSLDDARGNLSLEFIRIADAIDRVRRRDGKPPAWIGWENVPGVLSTKDNAFGAFLGGLCGCDAALDAPADGWPSAGVVAGPGRVVAWRVLDAQFFGVAQRRKRVFVLALGGAGAWACADALLPVGDRMRWHPAPSRETGQGFAAATAPSLTASGRGVERTGESRGQDPVIAVAAIAGTLNANGKAAGSATQQDAESGMLIAHSLRGEGFDASEDGTGRGTPLVPVAYGIRSDASRDGEARTPSADAEGNVRLRNPGMGVYRELAPTLDASAAHTVAATMQVRRLTPRECERLQGFADDYTAVPHRGKPAADGPRYKALGNSWAVPCARWVGHRINSVRKA